MPQSVARYTVSQVESLEYGFLMTVVFKNIGVVGRNDPDKISNVLSDVVSVLLERSLGVMVLDSLENSVRSETDFFSIESSIRGESSVVDLKSVWIFFSLLGIGSV